MRPILSKELPIFIKRFGNFIDAEIRCVEIISQTTIKVIIACQDEARAFDWVTLDLEFSSISDAKLLDNSKLSLLDTSSGMNILYANNNFHFCIGNYNSESGIKNAVSYIISSNIKYEENSF
ncbi:hypothetical protein [Sulfurimonas sp. CS5]|jgi:hypothetical protein|uniref:hypothetical protein n=1 Tax=Sulfurimonas sp. CS5 TaxID=3391145 RepID=UPI0039ECACEE